MQDRAWRRDTKGRASGVRGKREDGSVRCAGVWSCVGSSLFTA
jgi:hypothetical protein